MTTGFAPVLDTEPIDKFATDMTLAEQLVGEIGVAFLETEANARATQEAFDMLAESGMFTAEQLARLREQLGIQTEFEKLKTSVMNFTNGLSNLIQPVNDFYQNLADRSAERLAQVRQENEEQLALIAKRFGEESNRFKQAEIEAKKREKRAEDRAKKAAEKRKAFDLFNAINTGIGATLNAYEFGNKFGGPVLGAVFAAIAGGFSAALVSQIANNEPQGFINGGQVGGSPFATDAQTINVTGGEFVTNPQATAENLQTLEFINRGGRTQQASAGITVVIEGDVIGTDEFVRDSIMPGIERAIRDNVEFRV